MRLSKRLETVASFVRQGSRIADVGTDHGYIPIVLTERNVAAGAIAMDVGMGPLERAREHIRERGLEGQIDTRLCDGVKGLSSGEVDTVIVAGMGGELVIHIMEGGRGLWDSVEHWILSPQSELDKVRKFLDSHGFEIVKEDMVEEDGKYYTVMETVWKGGESKAGSQESAKTEEAGSEGGDIRAQDMSLQDTSLGEARYLFGPKLIENRHPVLMEFLEREEHILADIIEKLERQDSSRTLERKGELEQRLSWVRRAMEECSR